MKQAILVRHDLRLPKGKLAAQVAHASLEAAERSDREKVKAWRSQGAKKVVLRVADENELFAFKARAEEASLTTAAITDAGRTVVEPGTVTCLGIGPDREELIDRVTGGLKLV